MKEKKNPRSGRLRAAHQRSQRCWETAIGFGSLRGQSVCLGSGRSELPGRDQQRSGAGAGSRVPQRGVAGRGFASCRSSPFPTRARARRDVGPPATWQSSRAQLSIPEFLPPRTVFAKAVNMPGVGCVCQRYCTVERTWRNQPGNEACYCVFLILKRKWL